MGKIEGGTSVNTIAQDASMLFEFRSEDYRSLEACETYLEETIAARQSEEVQYSCELVESGRAQEKPILSRWHV